MGKLANGYLLFSAFFDLLHIVGYFKCFIFWVTPGCLAYWALVPYMLLLAWKWIYLILCNFLLFAFLEHFLFWVTPVSPGAPLLNHSSIHVTCYMKMDIFCSLYFFHLLLSVFLFWVTPGHPYWILIPSILLETCKMDIFYY